MSKNFSIGKKQQYLAPFLVITSIIFFIATLFKLPIIDSAPPDPYFFVKIVPMIYWVGFYFNLIIAGSLSFFSLKKKINNIFKILLFASFLFLTLYLHVIPKLMFVNKIYTDTHLFVSEILYVLQNGQTGYGFIESPALTYLVIQFTMVTGVNYQNFAELFPLMLPFVLFIYLFMLVRLLTRVNNFASTLLTYIAFNWLMFVYNRQSFGLCIQLLTWYYTLKVLLDKQVKIKWLIIMGLSFFGLVISHPASSFVLILNTFGIVFFFLVFKFKKKIHVIADEVAARSKILKKALFIGTIFFILWFTWQRYIGGSSFTAYQNLYVAFAEFLGQPNPASQVELITSAYTNVYFPIVQLRLFAPIILASTGIILSFFLLLRRSTLKNIVLSSWFLSTALTNIYVLYLKGWIERPFLYSLPSFSILLVVFLTLPAKENYRLIYKTILKTAKTFLLSSVVFFATMVPILMYSPTPFMYPPTTFLEEMDFLTQKGQGPVNIFILPATVGYYVLLNNASITLPKLNDFFNPETGVLINRIFNYNIIGTSFRVFVKEAFVVTQPNLVNLTLEIEDYMLNNPGFAKIFDADPWQHLYSKQVDSDPSN
jgi:hypothetical protein